MRVKGRGGIQRGVEEERVPHGYWWPEVGLPWRGVPPNPPQMLSSTSCSNMSARATTRTCGRYLNQLGTTENWPTECWLRARGGVE